MKKISTLLMLFCAFVGTALAQLPVASPAPAGGKWADGTKWYTIKRNKTNPIALSNADANGYLKLNGTSTKLIDGCWCVVGDDENGYQFYNLQAGTTQTLGAYGSETGGRMKMYDLDVTTDGSNTLTKTFDIKKLDGQDGYAFVKDHGTTNKWWNERGNYLAYWANNAAYSAGCTGSQYTFEEVDVTTLVDGYKTKAKAALDMVSFLGVDDAKTAIDAVAVNQNAFAEIDAIVNGVAQYVTIRNSHTDVRANHFLGVDMTKGKGNGHATFNYLLDVWSLKHDGAGAFYLYNVNNEVYLGTPSSNGVLNVTPTAGYTLEVVDGNKVKLKLGSQTLHLNNHAGNGPVVSTGYFLSSFDDLEKGEPASQWYVETDFSNLVSSYKNSVITELGGSISQLCTLLGVDASLVSTAKSAIEAISTTDYPTFAAIDAELKTLTDVIAAKNVVFQNSNTTDANRSNVYLATDMSDNKGRGNKEFYYNAVWSLRYATGKSPSFYLYNNLNQVYLGDPSGAGALTADPVAAYTFEIIENNMVELHTGGQTLHVHNWADCTLTSHDGNESASRWYITTIDITAELQELIDANASNYAEVPALGQYSKAGYDALVAAKGTVKTVKDLADAVAAFKASKNLPVFTISGTKDYVVGKSIYDDNSGSLYFKTTNDFDKSMWWRFDQTAITVGVTNEVVVTNYATGNKFWGAPSVKITETNEAIADDGIFLLYTAGNGNTVHFQNTNQVMVHFNSTEANSGSAMTFTYIGNSYDLDQLTEEKIATFAELQAAYDANIDFIYALGNGLGKYTCSDAAYLTLFDQTLTIAEAQAAKVLVEKATTDVSSLEGFIAVLNQASTKFQINLPVAGKYYRFQGACETSLSGYYITGHTNEDGGRIALTDAADASTIYYFDGTNLIAYQSGLVIGLNKDYYKFASVDDNSQPASKITFAGSPRKVGAYTIKSADRYFHYKVYNDAVEIDRCSTDIHSEHDWYITEVTELPVTITAAGYATFYAPVEVTLPAEVTAHTVTENGEWATLSEAINVVPANNGVILAGEANTYNLTISNTKAADLEGALAGTVAKTLVTKTEDDAYYVLGVKDEVVGLYNPVKGADNTKFYNAGHKAYWHIPATSQTAGFRFGGNTTAIESVLNNGVNVNAPIYDLSGRRVNNAVKGGIYIQNGKKFIVK